jgi:enoyl-CoA hydratase/carnithine racemase
MPTYDTYQHLKIEVSDKIATVTINRPERRNAMNKRLIREMQTIWRDLADDPAVLAILLTGAGSYFSVGGDVKEMAERPGGDFMDPGEVHDPSHGRRLISNILELDKPVVCAINGDAVGLACTIALFSDITVASETARIGDPHVKVGLVAGDGGTIIWPMLLGVSRAKEFLMRGMLVNGKDAERIALVNYALPADQVLDKARGIARELADGASWAIRWTKMSINKEIKQRANLTLDLAHAMEMLTLPMQDHREATKAFKEKRKPAFVGR